MEAADPFPLIDAMDAMRDAIEELNKVTREIGFELVCPNGKLGFCKVGTSSPIYRILLPEDLLTWEPGQELGAAYAFQVGVLVGIYRLFCAAGREVPSQPPALRSSWPQAWGRA